MITNAIEVTEIQKMNLACVPCTGVQNLESAYQALLQWAGEQGMPRDTLQPVTIYHDSFKNTPAQQVRMSACLNLQKQADASGAVGLASISAGKYIRGRFELLPEEFGNAWTALYHWMLEQGFAKAEADPFEVYHNNFREHPRGIAMVDMYVPIR